MIAFVTNRGIKILASKGSPSTAHTVIKITTPEIKSIRNFLIPFLLLASSFHFYLIIAILGLVFGYVFSLLINNIENLGMHHHLIAVLFIPVFAVINLIIISTSFSGIAALLEIESTVEPLTVSLVYVVFFIIPYAISLIRKL